jgi:hypothetical protein
MNDVVSRIINYCHPLTLWKISGALSSQIKQQQKPDTTHSFLAVMYFQIQERSDLLQVLKVWCEQHYKKLKPDPLNSKYNLFQKDVPTRFRIFAYENLKLKFTLKNLLAKAAKIDDMEFVNYLCNKELLWCSDIHMTILMKHGCYKREKLMPYLGKLSHYHGSSEQHLKAVKENILDRILKYDSERFGSGDNISELSVGRGLQGNERYPLYAIQRRAANNNNFELLENPRLYKHHMDSWLEEPILTVYRNGCKKPKILEYLNFTKEMLDELDPFSLMDSPSLDLVRYLREKGSNIADYFPQYYRALDIIEGKTTSITGPLSPELLAYVCQRVNVKPEQEAINQAFQSAVRMYSPDLIIYFYKDCTLPNKKEILLDRAKQDYDMLNWLETQ